MNKHSVIWFLRSQRSLSSCKSNNDKNSISSPANLNSKIQKLFESKQSKEALEIFDQNFKICNDFTIRMALNACTKSKNYELGDHIQLKLSPKSLNNSFIQASLIRFNMSKGDLTTANLIFSRIKNKSDHIYTAMIQGLLDHHMPESVFDLFDGTIMTSNKYIITLLFKACSQLGNDRAIRIGTELIDKMPQHIRDDNFVATSAISMLMKFKQVEKAETLFQSIKNKDIITYGSMMKGYNENKMFEKALDVFKNINIELDKVIYNIVFDSCAQLGNDRAVRIGMKLLDKMPRHIRDDNFVATSAIGMLMKFKQVEKAETLFQAIKNKDIITYGSMMKGYNENKMFEKALDLLEQIPFNINNVIFIFAFDICSQLGNDRAIRIGMKLLDKMPQHIRDDNFVATSAISMLMKFKQVEKAETLFQSIKNKNIRSFGSMMKGYNENKMFEKALDLLEQIPFNINNVIFIFAFDICSQLGNDRAIRIGTELIDKMPQHIRDDNFVATSAIGMLMKFKQVEKAETLFQAIKNKDIITYGSMMKGYNENKMFEKALDVFENINIELDKVIYNIVFDSCAQLGNDRAVRIGMKLLDKLPEHIRDDNFVLNLAMHMLMKFSDVERAENVFRMIKMKDVFSYGVLMNGYIINGAPEKCLKAFKEMKQERIIPNETIANILISACSRIGLARSCEDIIIQIPPDILRLKSIQYALIDLWGKCALIKKAYSIFDSIVTADIGAYVSMINAFGLNGMGSEAIELYRQIPSETRTELTHVCVLNACSHSGLVDEGRAIFNDIPVKTEKIFTTMIDCLSRLFLFDEAQSLIEEYEKTNKPSLFIYTSLLSGLRNNRNISLSEKIYTKMKKLFPDEKASLTTGAVLVSNIYGSLGEHELAKSFRSKEIKEFGQKIKTGLSYTEVEGEIVAFKAHDRSHPKSSEIYSELERLTFELIQHGYKFDASWVTRELYEGETIESVLNGHSERLAIAFNLIQRPAPKLIQITKNLRMCGDCHQATKLIAKIRKCSIIVRDANRIHHFQPNGQCSCQDHF